MMPLVLNTILAVGFVNKNSCMADVHYNNILGAAFLSNFPSYAPTPWGLGKRLIKLSK